MKIPLLLLLPPDPQAVSFAKSAMSQANVVVVLLLVLELVIVVGPTVVPWIVVPSIVVPLIVVPGTVVVNAPGIPLALATARAETLNGPMMCAAPVKNVVTGISRRTSTSWALPLYAFV